MSIDHIRSAEKALMKAANASPYATPEEIRATLAFATVHAQLAAIETARELAGVQGLHPYPIRSGDRTILGPQTVASADGKVITHRGVKYVPQPESVEPYELDDGYAVLVDSDGDKLHVIRSATPGEVYMHTEPNNVRVPLDTLRRILAAFETSEADT
ncbi:MAG: hypothetical protein ACRDT8_00050 [Micromonosporaceae bacterium]